MRCLAFAGDSYIVGPFYLYRCVSALPLSCVTGHLLGGKDTHMNKARSLSEDRQSGGGQKNTQVTYK